MGSLVSHERCIISQRYQASKMSCSSYLSKLLLVLCIHMDVCNTRRGEEMLALSTWRESVLGVSHSCSTENKEMGQVATATALCIPEGRISKQSPQCRTPCLITWHTHHGSTPRFLIGSHERGTQHEDRQSFAFTITAFQESMHPNPPSLVMQKRPSASGRHGEHMTLQILSSPLPLRK